MHTTSGTLVTDLTFSSLRTYFLHELEPQTPTCLRTCVWKGRLVWSARWWSCACPGPIAVTRSRGCRLSRASLAEVQPQIYNEVGSLLLPGSSRKWRMGQWTDTCSSSELPGVPGTRIPVKAAPLGAGLSSLRLPACMAPYLESRTASFSLSRNKQDRARLQGTVLTFGNVNSFWTLNGLLLPTHQHACLPFFSFDPVD